MHFGYQREYIHYYDDNDGDVNDDDDDDGNVNDDNDDDEDNSEHNIDHCIE